MTFSLRKHSDEADSDNVLTDRKTIQSGYRYALSLSGHHQDAEDLVQQAWVKCHRRYGSVRNLTMLYTTIRNLFYDRMRREKIVRFESMEDNGESDGGESEDGSADWRIDLESLLNKLRPEEREALYLNAVEGYTAKEIAKQTGTSRNTILSLIHRARKKLARVVDPDEPKISPAKENQ